MGVARDLHQFQYALGEEVDPVAPLVLVHVLARGAEQRLQVARHVRHEGLALAAEERDGPDDVPAGVEQRLAPQRPGQPGQDLRLVEGRLHLKDVLQVLADRGAQVDLHPLLVEVVVDERDELGRQALGVVHLGHQVGDGAHDVPEDGGPHEHGKGHEHALAVRRGRDVPVADGGHGGEGPVERSRVTLGQRAQAVGLRPAVIIAVTHKVEEAGQVVPNEA
mmetsp:Transcript_41129/g.72981  ORF Transcript_41129/g.72981 Transcript_41129/m.72981 type:complete len:221 (-) Transcript_41129:411-1073(-)